jgi:hypothetical protein
MLCPLLLGRTTQAPRGLTLQQTLRHKFRAATKIDPGGTIAQSAGLSAPLIGFESKYLCPSPSRNINRWEHSARDFGLSYRFATDAFRRRISLTRVKALERVKLTLTKYRASTPHRNSLPPTSLQQPLLAHLSQESFVQIFRPTDLSYGSVVRLLSYGSFVVANL